MSSRISYYLLFGFCWLLFLLPLRVLYILSDLLFLLFYYLFSYRRNITLTNLENSFPEKSSIELQKISRKFYRHFCDQLIESFKLIHLSKKQMARRFRYKNPELLDEMYKSGKSVIILAGHYSTWEWIVSLPMATQHKILAVYQPTSFKEFPRIYNYIGRRFGIEPVPMQKIFRRMLACKSNNELTCTFILGDQSPPPSGIKYWTNFLNQDTPAITGFERLSKTTDQAVIFVNIQRQKRGFYDVSFQTISDKPNEIEDFGITEDYLRTLETIITDRPEFWLWTHRRWKHKRAPLAE